MKKIITVATLTIAAALGDQTTTTFAADDGGMFKFTVCNDNAFSVSVAYADRQLDDSFMAHGWFVAKPNTCTDIAGQLRKGHFYFYGKSGNTTFKYGNDQVDTCIEPSAFTHPSGGRKCNTKYLKPFNHTIVWGEGHDHLTWTLNKSKVTQINNEAEIAN